MLRDHAGTDSKILSVWFADGTNYAGQDNIRERKHRLDEALAEVYEHLPAGARMLIEYKFFEPAFYHTDLADWGMAYTMCLKLGPQAQVLVDTGHHAQGTNIAHIVAFLLDEERLGGFHFNSPQVRRRRPDRRQRQPVGAVRDLHRAGKRRCRLANDVAYMIDQSHNIEPKLEAMLQSVLNCQVAYAKALLVDWKLLQEAQEAGDVLGAHRVLMDAFQTDVRPLLAQVRAEMNVPVDPIAALRANSYPHKVAGERATGNGSDSGYPGA